MITIKSNLLLYPLYYTEELTSLRGPFLRHSARAKQLLLKKCSNSGEPLATLRPIRPAQNLNFRPPAPQTSALPLDQQAGLITINTGKARQ